ncbi:hypothetical protein Peur_006021 [Populus x canadensis]
MVVLVFNLWVYRSWQALDGCVEVLCAINVAGLMHQLFSFASPAVKYECACGILDVAGTIGVKFEVKNAFCCRTPE